MRTDAARRVAGAGLVLVLVAGFSCGGAKIFRTSADEFAELAGTQVDQLKQLQPKVQAPVQQAFGTVESFAARAEEAAADILEVVCNDVFQAAIEAAGDFPTAADLPSAEAIADAVTSNGLADADAAAIGETIAAQATQAYDLASRDFAQGWNGFLAFVAGMCDVKGALEF